MATAPADAFTELNRILDAQHTSAGSIRKACAAVEACITSNRCGAVAAATQRSQQLL
jgi:hypothetical protein